jgi:osomolarity two-component system response regulator SSK1
MLELNLNKERNAFRNAAPSLPTFSLPPNLNDKLVSNKQKQQQSNTRPRLSKLRSAWLSQQSIEEDAFAEDTLIHVKLPPIPSVANSTLILNEITMVAMVATILNLVSCFSEHLGYKLQSLFLGQWLLILAWFALGSCSKDTLAKCLVYIRYSSLFMLVITSMISQRVTLLLPLLGSFLFYIAERLSYVDQKLQIETRSQLEAQQTNVQQAIDTALNAYGVRRTMYLSIVSQEIRDAALMVMATLEQFSPSSILCNTHELLSACSIAVPIASVSAINTTIKQACHISSHLNLLSRMLREADTHHVIPEEDRVKSFVNQEFDMGELIQNVGDALAGISAKLGVHFVIYHTDNGLYYTNVIGDEDATKHFLINVRSVSLMYYVLHLIVPIFSCFEICWKDAHQEPSLNWDCLLLLYQIHPRSKSHLISYKPLHLLSLLGYQLHSSLTPILQRNYSVILMERWNWRI